LPKFLHNLLNATIEPAAPAGKLTVIVPDVVFKKYPGCDSC
jgi:hypothetical protein